MNQVAPNATLPPQSPALPPDASGKSGSVSSAGNRRNYLSHPSLRNLDLVNEAFSFDKTALPEADASATPREVEILGDIVKMIEKYAVEIYKISMRGNHQTGKDITEAQVIVDPMLSSYLQRPGNPYDKMRAYAALLTQNEKRLVMTMLEAIDLKEFIYVDRKNPLTGNDANADGFDVHSARLKAGPIIEYYLQKNKEEGLRPIAGTRVPVDASMIYHASVAILLNALRHEFPGDYERMQQRFDHEKQKIRQDAWLAVQPENADGIPHDCRFPESVPELPRDPFSGVEFPEGTVGPLPALIALTLPTGKEVETNAAVVKHPVSRQHLVEFDDHTVAPKVRRYAVSNPDGPPGQGSYGLPSRIFDSREVALAVWSVVPSQESQDAHKAALNASLSAWLNHDVEDGY